MALINRLTPEQMMDAITMRAQGIEWAMIATQLGMKDTPALRRLIRETLREVDIQFAANFEFTILLDLARIEEVMPENMKLAKDGSHHHVGAFVKLLQAKMKIIEFLMDFMKVKVEAAGDHENHTFNRESQEWKRASLVINQKIQQGVYADPDDEDVDDIKPNVVGDLDEDDIKMLYDQVDQLEIMGGATVGKAIKEAAEETRITGVDTGGVGPDEPADHTPIAVL